MSLKQNKIDLKTQIKNRKNSEQRKSKNEVIPG
jgi:hypothetical protein